MIWEAVIAAAALADQTFQGSESFAIPSISSTARCRSRSSEIAAAARLSRRRYSREWENSILLRIVARAGLLAKHCVNRHVERAGDIDEAATWHAVGPVAERAA